MARPRGLGLAKEEEEEVLPIADEALLLDIVDFMLLASPRRTSFDLESLFESSSLVLRSRISVRSRASSFAFTIIGNHG